MDIHECQADVKEKLSRRIIQQVDVFSFDTGKLMLCGRNNEQAEGTYDQILEVIQKASDYDSLWDEFAKASLICPDRP